MYIGLPSLGLRSSSAGFSPASLFAAGEQGGWYDPSDMSTMWQDSAGTTPAVLEGPVGKLNDKSGLGNHLIQATAASRPTLKARYNLITKTDQFDDAIWVKQFSSITANQVVSPITGTTVADLWTPDGASNNHYLTTTITATTAPSTVIWYLKANTATMIQLAWGGSSTGFVNVDLVNGVLGTVGGDASGASVTPISGYPGWYICKATTSGSTAGPAIAGITSLTDTRVPNNTTTGSVYVAGCDIRLSADAALSIPAYQRVDTATSYDTSGFPMYLNFDGVDDGLASAATVDFSGTNKVTAFAGAYKASDAAGGLVCEQTSGNFDGSFYLGAPDRPGTVYGASTRGTLTANSGTITPFTAPTSNVLTIALDNGAGTAATQLQMRVNGVAKTITFDAGTTTAGNFANATFYVGRRGGTTLPFNGRLYQLIVRGATSTATQITSGERFTGSKMGVNL